MNGFSGKLIVIDGTDGTGKTTQLNLLKNRLEDAGYIVELADFPQYNTKSAGPIEEYLSGKYGTADEIDAYQASIFYAVDRFDANKRLRQWLSEGRVVLSNRYTSANMGHQGAKIANPLERRVFFNWLSDLEYKIFDIPRPDLTIILHLDPIIAQKRAQDRARADWTGKTNDIHENNLEHLKRAAEVYEDIARSFPDFQMISCAQGDRALSPEEVELLVWQAAKQVLNEQPIKYGRLEPISHLLGANQQIVENRHIIFPGQNNHGQALKEEVPASPTINSPSPILSTNQAPTPQLQLAVERLTPEAKLPLRARDGDAAFDLFAADYYSIPPYGQALVSTGLKLAIPHGYAGLIWDKSGLANTGITTMGGVIDSSYRGEVKVIIKNLSEDDFNIIPGRKIAQLIIQAISQPEISEQKITDQTERQDGGFGSTGQF